MRDARTRIIEIYQMPNGTIPFTEWFNSIRDRRAIERIRARLQSIKLGNLGEHKFVGNGVWELKINVGKGYRIYYGQVDQTIILLLCGGDKTSQNRDIELAIDYWTEYKERQNG